MLMAVVSAEMTELFCLSVIRKKVGSVSGGKVCDYIKVSFEWN